ncbi:MULTISPECIES: ABC transporter ATP-binding protein [unclassified Streptomyces]|uniref:ABC transporter ATP-binding protein n=1 Tax=unclassified Streptomyces TaxID=2593676 RepID=UPI0008056BFB|nr:ABC transporter ATP-binding protein [Streptomyces sp. OspMP-M45]MYR70738.1 ATP-binding cassette domain-containing protein [Streptomyces sp. SID4925]SBU97611.1 ATP-binding cassette, subfamily C [Streptomyces sp. OspMP-M45]
MTPAHGTLPVAGARRTRQELVRRLGAHRGRLAASLLTLLGGTAVTLATPPLLGGIVDAVADSGGKDRVLVLGVALVLVAVAGAALAYAGGRMLVVLVQGVLAALREDVFETAVHLPASTLESSDSSDVVSRVTRDVEAISDAASDVLPDVTAASFTIGLSLVGLAVLDFRLALAGLVCLPVHVLATRRFLARSHLVYGDVRRLESARGQSVIEAVHGAETIRAYRTQDRHLGALAAHSELAVARQRDGVRLRNRFTGLLNAAEFLGLAAVLVTGFALLGSGAVSVGTATAAALYFHRLFGPVGALLGSLDDIQRATAGLSRLVGVTDLGRDTRDSDAGDRIGDAHERSATADTRHRPAIDVKGVSFSYDGTRQALRDVSLHVPAGTSLALVGASGSGKSTLAHLIAGLGEPDRGEITTTDAEAARAPSRYLVTQEVHLFGGTLADNLRIARPTATDDELRRALREAGADWALETPSGLGTVLGAGGTPLDDGSVQHLALARALLADPDLIVLDEATAQSGPRTRTLLRTALERVVRGRTSVIVAHRLEQARDADHILILRRGEVAEQGTHDELLASAGEYAALWHAYTGTGPSSRPRTDPHTDPHTKEQHP